MAIHLKTLWMICSLMMMRNMAKEVSELFLLNPIANYFMKYLYLLMYSCTAMYYTSRFLVRGKVDGIILRNWFFSLSFAMRDSSDRSVSLPPLQCSTSTTVQPWQQRNKEDMKSQLASEPSTTW